jgi:predicted Kef-type K+ transport protein
VEPIRLWRAKAARSRFGSDVSDRFRTPFVGRELEKPLPIGIFERAPQRCRQTLAAALLQATSLSFLVVAGRIGVQLDLIRPAAYAALVAAGLLSVLLFPLTALMLLRGAGQKREDLLEPAR